MASVQTRPFTAVIHCGTALEGDNGQSTANFSPIGEIAGTATNGTINGAFSATLSNDDAASGVLEGGQNYLATFVLIPPAASESATQAETAQ